MTEARARRLLAEPPSENNLTRLKKGARTKPARAPNVYICRPDLSTSRLPDNSSPGHRASPSVSQDS
jgi:hypothetical protein